jgi:hypothetical protein
VIPAVITFGRTALRHWRALGIGLLVLLLGIQTLRLGAAKDSLDACRQARKLDRATYEQAQRDAKAKNEQQIQRIEKEQEEISDEIERDLTARLERLRSELRSKAAPRDPGSPQTGPNGQAPSGAVGEAGLCLAPEELLRAAENEERHDQLISWIEEQLKVQR